MSSTAKEQKPNFRLSSTAYGHPELNLLLIPSLTQADSVDKTRICLKSQKVFAVTKALVYTDR